MSYGRKGLAMMNRDNSEQLYIAHAGIFENQRLQGLPLVIALSHPQDAG